jgi:hypothetical protein
MLACPDFEELLIPFVFVLPIPITRGQATFATPATQVKPLHILALFEQCYTSGYFEVASTAGAFALF